MKISEGVGRFRLLFARERVRQESKKRCEGCDHTLSEWFVKYQPWPHGERWVMWCYRCHRLSPWANHGLTPDSE